jgi:retron-type reverse transcriptase
MKAVERQKERRVQVIQLLTLKQPVKTGKIGMEETKSVPITKQMVWQAYKKVKANRGGAGIDKESIADYEIKLKGNLYKVWNRLSSGSYFPPGVREVEIKKDNGKMRKLGIPTVSDRVAQTVVKDYLEPDIDRIFHNSS